MQNIKESLIQEREEILEKVRNIFTGKAIEAHLFGSLARKDEDAFSDIDIWFTFKNEEIEEILKNRFEFYKNVGEILHICEPPQNAPTSGIHSCVVYKTRVGYVTVDFYLCPLSTSHNVAEGKKLFGIDLPIKDMEYNTNKVIVSESYRIDFLIIFIIVAIKKLLRQKENPLDKLFAEYELLKNKYSIQAEPLTNKNQNFDSLKDLMEKIKKIANKNQKTVLEEISNFIEKIKTIN